MTAPTSSYSDFNDRIDRYLDGSLTPAETVEFERELETNAALRHELEQLAAVDSGLRRLMAPAPAVAVTHKPAVVGRIGSAKKGPSYIMLAIAAALALTASVWMVLPSAQATWETKAATYYQLQQDRGFKPYEVCTTDEQFREWTGRTLKMTLEPINIPGGPKWVGWNYSHLFSDFTAVLIAQVDGQYVLVMLDRQAPDVPADLKLPKGLHAFTRTINDLKLIEITPLDKPRVLDAVRPVPAK